MDNKSYPRQMQAAEDEWLLSDDGAECMRPGATGVYLENRLRRAFHAGRDAAQGFYRTKLAAETKRADDAEAQRDKATELLREMGYGFGRGDYPADFMMPGDVRYELLEALDAALAEMEKHDG